uniref:Hydrolase_4 domain-containing protein n=1 Tax=Parastrongyloides trichosuri TaxID=131310 RepID=A0A0N4Z8V8_PARTI
MKKFLQHISYTYEYIRNVRKKTIGGTILRSVIMNLESYAGSPIYVNAVVRDNMPNGSKVGCVVAIHDIPGNDKSYISLIKPLTNKGIRFIAINLPGFGYSSYDKKLKCSSNERLFYTETICKNIVHPTEKVIFIGLGRGCETAIKMTHDYYKKGSVGCIAISPYGIVNDHLHDHSSVAVIHHLFKSLKNFGSHQLQPLLDIIYGYGKNYYHDIHMIKIRGSKAMKRTIAEIDFSTLPPYIENISRQEQKFALVYGGRNKRIKPSASLSLAMYLDEYKHFKVFKNNTNVIIKRIKETFKNDISNIIVNVEYSKHKVQKVSPKFIADLCDVMFRTSKLNIDNNNNPD